MNNADLYKAGRNRVLAGIGIMIFAQTVAYLGGAMAMKPELVNHTTLNVVFVIMLIGVYVDLGGTYLLSEAKHRLG